jgi:hypothetical protein
MLLATILGISWCSLLNPGMSNADVAGHFQLAFATPSSFANVATTAKRSSYVVLQAWDGARAAQLKAANPGLTVLMYQDASAMTQGAGPHGLYSSGVGMEQADTAHPSWFLKDTSGRRLTEGDYSYLWMADIGNVDYQNAWADAVIARLSSGPWDGVFMDDVNTTAKYHTDPSKIALYPNDAAYQAATRSMLANVGPRIRAAGKLAIPNIGSWSENPAVAKDWLQFVDGAQDEMFVKYSTNADVGYRAAIDWKIQVNAIATAESMGKRYLAVTQVGRGDTQAERYGWASVLMAARNHTSYLAANNYASDPDWLPEYDAPIGDPTGAMSALGNGAYTRSFTNGLVVVNPSTSTVRVAFGGAYSGSGLRNATSATLAPNTGLVMTKGDQASAGPIVVSPPSAIGGGTSSSTPGSGSEAPSAGTPAVSAPAAPPVTAPAPVQTTPAPTSAPHKTTKPAPTKAKKKTAHVTKPLSKKAKAARLAAQRKAKAKAARAKAAKARAARARAARKTHGTHHPRSTVPVTA